MVVVSQTHNDVLIMPDFASQHHSDVPVQFGEALAAGTRLTLFSGDKPDRLFTVITFLIDAVSCVALNLKTGIPCYQVEDGLPRRSLGGGGRKAELIYSFTCQSKNQRNTGGASGDPTKQVLMPDQFLMGRW
jgi:hypothetical protein